MVYLGWNKHMFITNIQRLGISRQSEYVLKCDFTIENSIRNKSEFFFIIFQRPIQKTVKHIRYSILQK